VLVVQDKEVVFEYFAPTDSVSCDEGDEPNSRDKKYRQASITKSITSTLIGLAQTDPRIQPLDLTKTAGSVDEHLENEARNVVLEKVLQMRAGLEADDNGHHPDLRRRTIANVDSPDAVTFERAVSDLAELDEDDGRFRYSNMTAAILGVVLEARMKQTAGLGVATLRDALKKWIWDPIGMAGTARWKADRANSPSPYCCFNMRAYDLAKFGSYVLEQQREPGARLHAWLERATAYQGQVERDCYRDHPYSLGYGYLWWTFKERRLGFTGIGTGGNFLHIFPDAGIVIVQFGTLPSDAREDQVHDYWCRSFGAHELILDVLSR
jgi:CubicO group peptidase (beta-lactamase class C family)